MTENTLWDTQDRLRAFRDERGWLKYHTPANLAQAVAVEAGELNELFLWGNHPTIRDVAPEVADVMIYCLNLCDVLGIDPVQAINDKIDTNQQKYPAP